jgi:hypothetical protein
LPMNGQDNLYISAPHRLANDQKQWVVC